MKKNSSLRLKLNRETLRTLAGLEAEAAQGGSLAACASAVVSACGCPTQTCPTLCGLIC
jgi:hypothetical protein